MVVVGGATRLTGSGLSITEWKPIMGALPPMNDAAWAEAFHRYQQIPQYKLVNAGMTLNEFKGIFWWEWSHRLLGRLIGVIFAVPFVVFLVRRQIPRRLIWRCAGLFVLGGLQGLAGWWMVASGLSERVSVAPERLSLHLGLALILFVAVVWTALDAFAGQPRQASVTRWRTGALVFLGAVFLQCLLGALVAGTDAGFVYNDWPLMNGHLWPQDYAGNGFWQTLPTTRPRCSCTTASAPTPSPWLPPSSSPWPHAAVPWVQIRSRRPSSSAASWCCRSPWASPP
jgi:cytochrome c oxidase assembly protein subunit 15